MATKNSDTAELVPVPIAVDANVPQLDPMPNAQIISELERKESQGTAGQPVIDTRDYPNFDAVEYNYEDFGAIIDPAGRYSDFGIQAKGTIQFGAKIFPLNADDREKLYRPRRVNMAAGPRLMALQPMGEFITESQAFRGVPFRTINGLERVCW